MEVYLVGNIDVVFIKVFKYYELLILNKYCVIKDEELEVICEFFLKCKID